MTKINIELETSIATEVDASGMIKIQTTGKVVGKEALGDLESTIYASPEDTDEVKKIHQIDTVSTVMGRLKLEINQSL